MSKVLINKVTGNPYKDEQLKLVSVSENSIPNVNGTRYHIVTGDMETKQGTKRVSALMYDSNYKLGKEQNVLNPGTILRCRVEKTPGRKDLLIVVSHLPVGQRLEADAFDWDFEAEQGTAATPAVGAEVKSSKPATV